MASISSAICSICLKAMARDARQRYESMRDFSKALRGYLQAISAASQSGIGLPSVAAYGFSPAPPPASAPPLAPTPAPDRIEFACPQCGLPVRTPLATAGKKGKCPSCGAVVPIPAHTPAAGAVRPDAGVSPGRLVAQESAPPPRIEFACPHCHNLVRTPSGSAGKKGRCPSCKRVVKIPGDPAG